MELSGILFTYHEALTAFESGPVDYTKAVIYVGGITELFNAVPYLAPLQERLCKQGWALIQVQLSSSGNGYGTSSLRQDSEEIDHLIQHLKTKRNKEKIVLLGHSTGCQDSYWHNKYGEMKANGYILQAPISDRLVMMNSDPTRYTKLLVDAKQMIKDGRSEELMPRQPYLAPITAYRFASLVDYRGDDDVFSPDLKDKDLIEIYSDVTRPICWVYSDQDECYVPTEGAEDKQKVMERFQSFCPAIKMIDNVPFGNHCMSDERSFPHFFNTVEKFLKLVE